MGQAVAIRPARAGVTATTTVVGLRMISVGLVGLVAGVGLGVALLDASLPASAAFYAQFKQLVIAAYRPMPVLIGIALLAGVAVLSLVRRDRVDFWLTLAGLVAVLASLVITLAVLGPLNTQIATWSADAVPSGWEQVQDRWQTANVVREAVVVAGFGLLLAAGLRRRAR